MANLAQIQSIAQGQFFVKDSLGNLVELKVGDTVSLNDTIVAASSNTDLSKIEILFDTNELITLSQGEQLLDATLLASTFGNEELAFDKQEVDETLNAWNNAQDGDETDMETAAGDVTEQATNAGDERAADGGALRSKFNSRDGASTDVRSDLREASWTDGIERTIEDSENMLLEQPLPVVYTIIEGIDVVNEGDSANYVVKLQDAAGNPVIATQDTIIYVRYTNKTTQDGDTQYNNENIIEVVIKAGTSQTEFTIKTNDDYLADNGEIYNVSITGNNSTEFDMRTGDVAGNKTNVDTTILDNSNPLNPGGEDGVYGSEDIVFAIIEGTTAVKEGDTAQYVVKLVDKDGNPVTVTKDTTVTVVYKDKTTNDGLDTNKSNGEKITVVIKANETSAEFKVETKDDYLADNGEVYNVAIEKVEDQGQFEKVYIGDINGDKTNVDTEILDNSKDTPTDPYDQTTTPPVESDLDTITIRLFALDKDGNRVPANEVAEGSQASYVAVAFDKNETELTLNETVEVTFGKTGDSATAGGVDYVSTTQTVTLGTPFNTNTVDDYLADNSEIYSVQITDKTLSNANKYETVVIDTTSVTTTIKDDTDNTPNNPDDNKVEDNQEQVLLKIFAADSTGAPLKDGSGNYLTVNEVPEGNKAYYVVLAFKPNETTFSDSTKLTIQSGSVEIQTFDKTSGLIATGTAFQTANDGTQDYVLKTQTVNLGDAIEVQTLDDWKADNGEQYEVKIKSYEHPITGAVYENVKTDLNAVTTTIKDDTDNTPNNPNDNKVEENQEQVILKIVVSDANGVPKTDAQGNYIVVNNVNEGVDSHYVVLAFEPTSNGVYSTSTKLADNLQGGTVTVSTQSVENGATGVTTASKIDGSEDYITKSTVEIKVGGGSGNVFSVKTLDDYKAENETNETFKVVIDTNSYKHPNNNVANAKYENVTIDNTGVTTTIVDNSADKNKPVETNPTIDDGTNPTYGQEDTVWAVIEANPTSVIEGNKVTYTVKLVDKNGNAVTVSSETNVTIKFAGGTNPADLADLLKIFGSDGTTEITGFDSTEQKLTIKIPANGSQTQFTIQTKDDFTQEGSETFDLSISKIDSTEFENLVFDKTKTGADNKVTTEIKDGVTLGDPKNAYVDEDNFYKNDFNNTDSSSEYTTKNISNFDNKTGHIKGDLGIIAPIEDNGYTLSFDNTINVYKGNENATETNIYGDGTALKSGGNEIKYKLVGTDKIVAYTGTEANYDKNKVFEITLEKDNNGKYTGDYKYTQYKNIDHPIDGDDKSINDDDITFEFGFKISDQGSTSSVQTFKVTVNDSTPIAGEKTLTIYEDNNGQGAYTFVLSDEGFKGNTIKISNDGGNTYKDLTTSSKNGANSIDILENGQKIGTLKNLGSGKLQFIPEPDYSKYSDDNLPNFKYQVSDTDGDYAEGTVNIKVKPVADAPTIFVKNIETKEDAGNTQEGTNKVALELKVPSLSKDSDATSQTSPTGYTAKQNNNVTKTNPILDGAGDKNGTGIGDHPERNGEITLKFTNGTNVKGAKLYSGDTKVADISTNNQPIKVVIVKTSGGTDIDTTYHHSGTLPVKGGNVLYLTKEEYESLKIQHAEDNDTNIQINIGVTSYEVNDSGEPLFGNTDYIDNNNLNLKKDSSATMTVSIKPVTDDIELKFDNATVNGEVLGTIDGKTFVFKNEIIKEEGIINFKELLTNTSGTTDGKNGTKKGDLDGSEIRWYTVKFEGNSKDHPDYLIINGKTVSLSNGEYKYEFTASENTKADPDFKVQFPNGYSGGILRGELTLHVQDRGVEEKDDSNNWGNELTQTVKFEVAVNPVADDATVKVGQSIGYEDAGRNTDKNVQDKDGTIKHPENGITLDIKVSSTDTDGSETFTVTIKDIPNGSGLYVYDKSSASYKLVEVSNDGTITIDGQAVTGDKSGNISVKEENGKFAVEIKDYQNTEQPKFIPPHNEHRDFTLNVEAKTVDRVYDKDGNIVEENIQTVATSKPITVIVKDVADSVVGNDYNQETLVATPNTKDEVKGTHKPYNAIVNEDTEIKLSSIFNHDGKGGFDSTKLSSYDSASEDLTIVIKDLPKDVTLEGNVNYINGQYIFKASDIGGITIKTPSNYSGELNFGITYITTERGEVVDGKTIASKTFGSEKSTDNVSIFVKPTIDAEFKSSTTKAEDIDATVVGGKSYYNLNLGINKNGDNDETLEEVVIYESDEYTLFIKDENGDLKPLTYTNGEANIPLKDLGSIYVQAKENENGEVNIKGKYTVKDSHYGTKDSNYETTQTKDFTHTLKINPVTDKPELKIESISDLTNSEVNGTKVSIKNSTASFTVNTKTTSIDTDGSEKVVKIVISGVPQGVTIANISDKLGQDKEGVSLYEHNGVYVIEVNENITSLNGILENIKFDINGGNFIDRDITITTYTEDSGNGDIKQDSQTINIIKDYGTGGTGQGIVLETKPYKSTEDTKFSLLNIFDVSGGQQTGEIKIKIDNGTLEGYEKDSNGYYTINLKGNAADIGTILSQIKVIPDLNFNDNKGKMKLTVSGFGLVDETVDISVKPLTDIAEITIIPENGTEISENGEFKFDIKLTNNVDVGTTLKDNVIYIKAVENYKDTAETATGKIYYIDANGYKQPLSADGKFELKDGYTIDNLPKFVYEAGENRNGNVTINVTSENKELNADNYKEANGSTTITVKPVVSSTITITKEDGVEDGDMAKATLKVENKDPSETFDSVIIKVQKGVGVYYNNGSKLAMNAGEENGEVTWIVPANRISDSNDTLTEVFFKGSEHLAGDINFTATVVAKDGDVVVEKTLEEKVYIREVADGVTIDPTKTGIDKNAFEWTTLNLNANMKDVDGSEKMHFSLEGLDSSAQFRVKNSDGTYTDLSSKASQDASGKWTINEIEAKDINSIEISHDKSVSGVKVEASTVDGDNVSTSDPVTGTFDLSYKADAKFDKGTFTLAKDMDIDFNNIGKLGFTNVEKIDLGAGNGKNELLNLTLQDVLDMGKKDGSGNINLKILGNSDDKLTFADKSQWQKSDTPTFEGGKTFTEWSNTSGDSTVTLKIEQPISDGITN
ncbi:hypothetical protein N5T79_04440 [Aliarcobacter cryaerophilus]|uniref:hypothetical protein n=1 Tax=Aliarcobacter cryaerophilus TaxID=28198 RepID=UPI0021B6D14B|nr:hypothetical protein [Aliarcobacter cryaerophilus]MCT7528383.1 hypothetical protein [Aliarcobacter cryaerophilus]